ncbi:hypothetical protein [Pseudomonas batumici]|uniref:hypothetical protein n=1 Tax=Pseudomonas batumici TaxID=226910 RepID=UPI003BAFD9A6
MSVQVAQTGLLDGMIGTVFATIKVESEAFQWAPDAAKANQQPKRVPLPAQFPHAPIHHEPDNSLCQCDCAVKTSPPFSALDTPISVGYRSVSL